MKSSTSQFIVGLLAGLLGACLLFAFIGQRRDGTGPNPEGRELVIAHALPVEHPVHKGIVEFGEELKQLSGGRLSVKIFPAEQLGKETEMLEKIQQGSIDIIKVSAAPIGNFVPTYQLFSLPYLFRDEAHFWKCLDGELGDDLLMAMEQNGEGQPSGLVGLCYYDAGSRSFYTTKPVSSPADLKGLKVRVMQDPVAQDAVNAMGASAVSISFGELYTSLKVGGVQGAENNAPSFLTSRHFEICKNYALDAHSRIPDVLVASSKLWNSLSETERGWVMEAAKRSSIFQRKLWAEESAKAMEELKANGVTVREVDLAEFQKATEPVIRKYAKGPIAEMVNRIKAVQ